MFISVNDTVKIDFSSQKQPVRRSLSDASLTSHLQIKVFIFGKKSSHYSGVEFSKIVDISNI